MLSLRVGDVFQFDRVVDRITIERRFTKGRRTGQTRVVNDAVRDGLTDWIGEMARQGRALINAPLFLSRSCRMKPISRVWVYRLLRKIYRANKMTGKLGTHSMRKTFAARIHPLLGADMVKTQAALGHQYMESTIRYLSFLQEEIDRATLSLCAPTQNG
jgi:integrase